MKKLLGIVVLGLLWCNTSFALNGLEGIKEFELQVEVDEACGVTKYKIENSVRYLISNSKIKINDTSPNTIVVDVAVMKGVAGCFSNQTVRVVNWRQLKNTAKNTVVVPLVLWETGSIRKGPPDSFAMNTVHLTENQIKEFVVKWSMVNK